MTPPTQEELRRRLGLSARTNLSKLNQGKMLMTREYGGRIVDAVRQDDDSFTLADLGAPSLEAAEVEPTVLDRLESLAADLAKVATKQASMAREIRHLRARVRQLEAQPSPGEVPSTDQMRR